MSVSSSDGVYQAAKVATRAATQAEKEAEARILDARRRAREAENQSEERIQAAKDRYEKENDHERVRQATSVEAVRKKGYDSVRTTQRDVSKALTQVEEQGKDQLEDRQEHYRNLLYQTEKHGRDQANEIELKNHQLQEHLIRSGREENESLQRQNAERTAQLRNETEERFVKEKELADQKRETESHRHLARQEATEERHQELFDRTVAASREVLNNLRLRASRQLVEIRDDSTRKLNAFSERNEDPFYQHIDLQTKLSETSDAFVLTAKIPEHERQHVSVSVRNQQVILSGHRRNDDVQSLESGQERRTSAYQAYSESHPLSQDVDAREIRKRFDGDLLIVELPKKNTYSRQPHQPKRDVTKLRADRPHFPDNLPIKETAEAPRSPDGTLLAIQPSGAGSQSRADKPLA